MKLEEFFIAIRNAEGDLKQRIMNKCFKEHGGLGQMMQSKVCQKEEPYEALSYMWEALPTAAAEWDHTKGKPSTCWMKVVRRFVERDRYRNINVAGVYMPRTSTIHYSKGSLNSIE